MRSSSVGITQAETALPGREMRGPWCALAAGSRLTPSQALTAAGRGSAAMLGLSDRGPIEKGKRADFVVLAANPLEDIKNTRQLVSIWHGGKEVQPRARTVATK